MYDIDKYIFAFVGRSELELLSKASIFFYCCYSCMTESDPVVIVAVKC